MEKVEKIFVAGHRGLVGSAIVRKLSAKGFTNLLTRSRTEVDLANARAVEDFFRVERQAGADDVIDERAAAGMVEDFSKAGLEAGAFASGEDEDGCVVIGHGRSIVHWTRSFDNAGIIGAGGEQEKPKRAGQAPPLQGKLFGSIGGGVLGRLADSRGGVVLGGDFPGGGVGKQAAD